jgi:hypothetical protein
MWIRVNEEVDALVQYRKEIHPPVLKSINWKGTRRDFVGQPLIERADGSLYYEVRDRSTRYAIRFDPSRQRWTLEGIDDSWIMGPHDIPHPRYFPPP